MTINSFSTQINLTSPCNSLKGPWFAYLEISFENWLYPRKLPNCALGKK
jgi:hypothetical protein